MCACVFWPCLCMHLPPSVFPTRANIHSSPYLRYDNDKKKGTKGAHAHTVGLSGGLTSTLGSRPGTAEGHGHSHTHNHGQGHDAVHQDHAAHDGASGDDPSLASFANNSDSAMLLRVWNVKKSDPTVPVYVKSVNRKLAAIKPR